MKSFIFNGIANVLLVTSLTHCVSMKNAGTENNSFLKRREIVEMDIAGSLLIEDDSNVRHKRHADKPLHLSVHGQRRIDTTDARRKRRNNGNHFGSAIYFDGSGQLLKLRFLTKHGIIVLPDEQFTVQFWAKPEGGQARYTPIIGEY